MYKITTTPLGGDEYWFKPTYAVLRQDRSTKILEAVFHTFDHAQLYQNTRLAQTSFVSFVIEKIVEQK